MVLFPLAAGVVFGSALSNPYALGIITIFLLILVLYSLEIIQLHFLQKVQTIGHKIGGEGYLGSFFMGLASGLVAAPCVGPVLVTILLVAAGGESTRWGGLLLFSYACGLGLPFLILGTYSSLLVKLPRSGTWLNLIKFVSALGIFLTAAFLHQRFLNRAIFNSGIDSLPIVLGGLIAFGLLFARHSYRHHRNLLKMFAAILITFPLYVFTLYEVPSQASKVQASDEPHWFPKLEEGLSDAKDAHRGNDC